MKSYQTWREQEEGETSNEVLTQITVAATRLNVLLQKLEEMGFDDEEHADDLKKVKETSDAMLKNLRSLSQKVKGIDELL